MSATVADFAYGHFGGNRVRLVSVLCVLMVSMFYMAPQMYGAGNTWKILVGRSFLPANAEGMFLGVNSIYLSGVTVVAGIMMFYVAMGGMKGTTLNQVIQFWWLWLAMFLVVAFAFGQGFNYPNRRRGTPPGTPDCGSISSGTRFSTATQPPSSTPRRAPVPATRNPPCRPRSSFSQEAVPPKSPITGPSWSRPPASSTPSIRPAGSPSSPTKP